MPDYFFIILRIIDSLWFLWLLTWLISAFFTKRTIRRQPHRTRMLLLLAVVAAIMLIQANRFHVHFLNIEILPRSFPLAIAGCFLCAAGLFLTVFARFYLGRNWSGTITIKENHELIQSGPYRFVRHPIYSGLLLAILGTFLALIPTLAGLLAYALISLSLLLKLRGEEKIMTSQFPDAYPAYKTKVPGAIIPWLL